MAYFIVLVWSCLPSNSTKMRKKMKKKLLLYKECNGVYVYPVAQREAAVAPEFKGNVVAVESYTEYALDSLEIFNVGWPTGPTTTWAAASSSCASAMPLPRRWPG
jgi:hypothetical protein